MDEKQWLASTDGRAMIETLRGRHPRPSSCIRLSIPSDRKMRLFACGCHRRDMALWYPEQDRSYATRVVEAAELIADGGQVDDPQLLTMEPHRWTVLRDEAAVAAHFLAGYPDEVEAARRAELARCIFGNPWKPARAGQHALYQTGDRDAPDCVKDSNGEVVLGLCRRCRKGESELVEPCADLAGWLRWNGGLVRTMAKAIYDDRTFDQLPILADALEEAGCDNRRILAHCRKGTLHARGCWVLDLILGKR